LDIAFLKRETEIEDIGKNSRVDFITPVVPVPRCELHNLQALSFVPLKRMMVLYKVIRASSLFKLDL